jgi:DNA-binding MarR family transcriptional regulator
MPKTLRRPTRAADPLPAPAARGAARPRDEGLELARRLGLDDVPPWASYVHRGRRECAFSQLKLMGRVVNTIYDQALEPVGLRASQLALMWAIVATEPVDMTSLGEITYTDQTTLSRTVQTLRRMRLVSVRAGADRRVKLLALSASGKARFAAAMPYWENAQRQAARLMPLGLVDELGKQVRKRLRETA